MSDATVIARRILDELQAAVTARDLDRLGSLFADGLVLFGTAAANTDEVASRAYLAAVLGAEATPRWTWDEVVPVVEAPGVLAFAVVGTVGAVDDGGQQHMAPEPFRLSCVAVERSGRWRIRHFHGSQPASAG